MLPKRFGSAANFCFTRFMDTPPCQFVNLFQGVAKDNHQDTQNIQADNCLAPAASMSQLDNCFTPLPDLSHQWVQTLGEGKAQSTCQQKESRTLTLHTKLCHSILLIHHHTVGISVGMHTASKMQHSRSIGVEKGYALCHPTLSKLIQVDGHALAVSQYSFPQLLCWVSLDVMLGFIWVSLHVPYWVCWVCLGVVGCGSESESNLNLSQSLSQSRCCPCTAVIGNGAINRMR